MQKSGKVMILDLGTMICVAALFVSHSNSPRPVSAPSLLGHKF